MHKTINDIIKENIEKNSTKIKRKKDNKYKENTLSKIGGEINNITPTMVQRIILKSIDKIKKMTSDVSFHDMSQEQIEEFDKKIIYLRNKTAEQFFGELHKTETVDSFITTLKRKHILGKFDLKNLSTNETQKLKALKLLNDKTKVKQILLEDIEREDNIIKTFQSYVSYNMFNNNE